MNEAYYQFINLNNDEKNLIHSLPKLNCDDCRMCRSKDGEISPFSSQVKCCTYEPFLPNYLLGAMIQEKGFEFFDQTFNKASGVLMPIGYFPSFELKNKLENNPKLFGQSTDVRCHFYLNGQCSIWPYRGSQCRSYFCWQEHEKAHAESSNKINKFLNEKEFITLQNALALWAYPPKKWFEQLDILARWGRDLNLLDQIDSLQGYHWQGVGVSRAEFYLSIRRLLI